MTSDGYRSWTGVAQAIKARATDQVRRGEASNVQNAIREAHFDRFLCRVFAAGDESDWLLKGGMSLLARVPRARATKDLDLASRATDLDEALAALQRVAEIDLDDHLRFELVSTRETGLGDNQPGTQTRNTVFTCWDRDTGRRVAQIPIDIVVDHLPIGAVEVMEPVYRLDLPKPLISHPYRLWPTVDQIADTVCATMTTYAGAPSSRIKDLVDLAVIATTQRVSLAELRQALELKRTLSQIPPFEDFTPPPAWARGYTQLASTAPAAAGLADFDQAIRLVADLVHPALRPSSTTNQWWSPGHGWTDGQSPDSAPSTDSTGSVWVRPHSRSDGPVRGHHRSPRS